VKVETVSIIEAALKSDAGITIQQRNRILKFIRGNGEADEPQSNGNGHAPRIYSRAEVAAALGGRSLQYVDLLCRRKQLIKFFPRGNKRSTGILGTSLELFVEGNGQMARPA
jgi:hypothetical protein